jgi:sugar phosphate isomerase/epimerase
MLGPEDLSLCCGTVRQADFRQLVDAAAANGFRAISLWPHLYLNARAQGLSDTDLRTILEDHGLVIAELDPLCSWIPGCVPPAGRGSMTPAFYETIKTFFSYSEDLFFRIADALGARHLNVVQLFPPAIDTPVVIEAFGGVCDRAARHGLLVSLEFLPWCPIANLATARAIVEAANRPNGGVMFDTWHHFRSGGTSAELRKLSGRAIAAIQFNDAPREPGPDLLTETVTARLLPGDGAIDLVGHIQAWDAIGNTAPIGVEIFSTELDALSPVEAARRAAEATRRVLRRARAGQ